MHQRYHIDDTSEIITPGIVLFRDILEGNISKMVEIARDPARMRPHCKTHKMREVVRLQLEAGIAKHKVATFAEAEMVVAAGAKNVFLAYNLVGPNIGRAVKFVELYPDVAFSVTADARGPIELLGKAMHAAPRTLNMSSVRPTTRKRHEVRPH